MPFEDITLEQLRAATKEQIINVINNRLQNMTKKQIIILILRLVGVEIDTYELEETIDSQDGPNGQILRRYVRKDVLGNILSKLNIDWTYYDNGPVHEITLTDLDPSDNITAKRIIKHFLDGRQPNLIQEQ